MALSAVECKNTLATKFRQSELCLNVLKELEHVNQSLAEGVKGPDEPVDYATSFLYQVRELNLETDSKIWKHLLH